MPGREFAISAPLKIFGGLGLLAVVVAIAVPGLVQATRGSGDRNASYSLKTLASAEADFRANDRDGNRICDYWTGDVAGLYCISPGRYEPEPANAIKLIELSVARADSDPLKGVTSPYYVHIGYFAKLDSKAGYWYWALRADASVTPPQPYRQKPIGTPPSGPYYNSSRFGFMAYPDSLSAGRFVFIINEGNTIFRRRIDALFRPSERVPPGPVTHPDFLDWPSDKSLKENWARLD